MGPNVRLSVLAEALSPSTVTPSAAMCWTRLTSTRPGARGSRTATTSPTRGRTATNSSRSPGSRAGVMLSPTTSTRPKALTARLASVAAIPELIRSLPMRILPRLLAAADRVNPPTPAYAHCDLPCGVYDPAQARIEAESVKACQEKYQGNDDPVFRERAVQIKEERADLVKHHLWVLWTDYFKPDHLAKYPDLHDKFWKATKLAGDSKKSLDPAQVQQLLDAIGEIDKIFWETKKG